MVRGVFEIAAASFRNEVWRPGSLEHLCAAYRCINYANLGEKK